MFAHASHFGIEASTFINVGRDYVVNIGGAQTPVRPELGIDNVLCCPPPSKDFVGRESILQKLFKFFVAPVVSITCEKPEMMEDIVTRVKGWSGFSFVKWDASSEDGLENGLDEWNSVVGRTPKNTLLMLESADPSLELDSYIPYSLQTPVLILSMSSRISAFASNPGCIFMPPASMNKPAYRKFLDDVRRAFVCGQRIVPLVARGGTGKTQVARKFVQEYGWR
ncbi:hypothetical protein BDP27DRAFT_1370191 [Rhodocollybia butyracea]|uniref:Uncharacterized protein n=1 Tax=Rhodocollybia butyracea TaxID=206335 RepID=A0A9P5PCH7_9AGAR|nr:hypothetical protein BDP27DRAFT_1370191 [Rhodocollybia butyracea]